MKTLFLSTNSFPHNDRETLLGPKIQLLSEKFNRIYVLSATPKTSVEIFIPKNVSSFYVDTRLNVIDKIRAFLGVFSLLIFQEIIDLKTLKISMNWKKIKVALNAMYISKRYSRVVRQIVNKNNLQTDKLFFHAYWCTEFPICFSELKISFPHAHFSSRMHAYDLYEERHNPNYLPFRKVIYSVCDKLFFISEQGKEYFKNTYKIENDSKLIVNYLGVAKPNFVNLSNMNSAESKKELVLVSCSSMIALKRIDLIIDSLSQINDVNICWFHFGDGELKDELVLYASQKLSELNNINYFFQGHVSNEYINEFYHLNKVDLFINVSKYEGVPISMMEAMAYGIPCVGTNVGGVIEIVNNENGFLFEVNFKSNSLAKTIVDFAFKSKLDRLKFIENSLITFENRFQLDINIKLFIKFLFGEKH
jgi:glycosyltransferase involved in cell wall biosynthesis